MKEISLNDLLRAFCSILDIASNRRNNHSRRTAYVALRLAKIFNLPIVNQQRVYYASLLHDIGMAGNLAKYSIDKFHLESDLIKIHVDIGYDIVKSMPLLGINIPELVKFHHEQWNGSGPFGLKYNQIPLEAQIINIADRFELKLSNDNLIEKRESIKSYFLDNRGILFNEYVVDKFFELFDKLDFWLDLENREIDIILCNIEPRRTSIIDIYDLISIAKAFSMVLDSKSSFTYTHSKGVSDYAELLAKKMKMDSDLVLKVKASALLHDIGKFIVPTEILDKPGKLDKNELAIIRRHSYYTHFILSQISGLERIARWASNHHENLIGTGYPRRLNYKNLDEIDRLISISDQFQALTEERPYRKALSFSKAFNILDESAAKNIIDNEILLLLKNTL